MSIASRFERHGRRGAGIDLWLTSYSDPRLDGVLDQYRELLTPEERAQEAKFFFPKDRRRYLVTRALLRTTLSRYAEVSHHAWVFGKNSFGRPEVLHEAEAISKIRFNISHSGDLIALAVTYGNEVGVDLECCQSRPRLVDVAQRYFAPQEVTVMGAMAESDRQYRFFEYWTLKEAYIKARGMGLSMPLDQFWFDFSVPEQVHLHIAEELGDQGANWWLWQWACDDNYLLALCAQHTDAECPPLQCRHVLPFLVDEPFPVRLLRSSLGRAMRAS